MHVRRAILGLRKELKSLTAERVTLANWAATFGEALCPGSLPDTFGEGMRAAKGQVSRILSATYDAKRTNDDTIKRRSEG